MRIVLIYPPVWKIPPVGDDVIAAGEGPPAGIHASRLLSGDILSIPVGLLSLAAQAKAAGHSVTVLNLISIPWQDVVAAITEHPAELYGLSCFTVNRRGTMSLARLIRRLYPRAHIATGGPHATALPEGMLSFCDAIDTVIIGEGERSFAELITRLERNDSPHGIAGTAWREGKNVFFGPPGQRIKDLDRLVPPCEYFPDYLLTTTRGCAWDCAFCSSTCIWGRKVTANSPAFVLGELETMVKRHGLTAIAIKDENFTAQRSRALEICDGIRRRELNFLWSCDTRADCLDEELLYHMRASGCRRISIGVESGSLRVLKALNKRLQLSDVRRATETAGKFGLQVRLYMIVGSPQESTETLRHSIEFVQSLRPYEVIWNPFTLLPGTRTFAEAVDKGAVRVEQFFTEDFFEYIPLEHDQDPERREILLWLSSNQGLQRFTGPGIRELQEIVRIFPDLHSAHLDLAHGCLREGLLSDAEHCLETALRLKYPQPGIIENYRACIAALRGDIKKAFIHLLEAKKLGYHAVVERNIASARMWIESGGLDSRRPLELEADNGFEVTRPLCQPLTPGPLESFRY